MNYNELYDYIEHFINFSYQLPPEADDDLGAIFHYYELISRCDDENEKLDLLNKTYVKARFIEYKYGKEFEILKTIPNYNYLFKLIERAESLDNIEEQMKLISSIDIQKVNTVKLMDKLDEVKMVTEADLTNDVLNSIKFVFENSNIRKGLTNEDIYKLFINYYMLKNNNISIAKTERNLIDVMRKVWSKTLTDPKVFKNGNSFSFLIHNFLTGESLENQIEVMKENRIDRVSSSLITNNFTGMYNGDTGRRIGFIYPPDAKIVTIGKHDLYSYESDKYKVVKNKEYASPILSPGFLETYCKKLASDNGKDFDYNSIYNEVLIGESKPVAIFLMGYGEKELNPDYIPTKKLAEKLGLPFVEIDMSVYRQKHNLPMLNTDGKKYIAKQTIMSLFGFDNNGHMDEKQISMLYNMIDNYYEELGNIYIKLKEKGEATRENIMLAFYQLFQNRAENNLDQSVNDNNSGKIR